MNNTLYIAIPLITGIICWIFGYLIGRLNPKPGDGNNHASLKADLAACRANANNLSDKIAALEHELYEIKTAKPAEKVSFSAAAPVAKKAQKTQKQPSKPAPKSTPKPAAKPSSSSFDAAKAKAAMGKKVNENDLKLVEGVGPKIADLFIADGIKTWQQLADSSVERCQKILTAAGDRYKMHNPGTWPRQAKMMAEGNWAELKAWTDKLDGGKE
jgi:predicted flap endonuclease-1-like 5' DNA nuclease